MASFRLNRQSRGALARLPSEAALGGIALFVVGVGAGAWWALSRIDGAVRESAGRGLQTVLAESREAVHHWATRQQAEAATMAATKGLAGVVDQLAIARARTGTAEAPSGDAYRLLEGAIRANDLEGFWIIDGDETTLTRWPDSLPASLPRFMTPALERAMDGLPSFSPFPGDTAHVPRLAAFAPIRDASGITTAVLVTSLASQREFARLTEQSRNRALGHAYFFDRAGRLLGSGDPTSDDTAGTPLVVPGTGRLTEMAQSAIHGNAGLDLRGYLNHRGISVVGAWEWDDQLGLGLAAESEAGEAYHVLDVARSALLGALLVTLVLFTAVLVMLRQSKHRAVTLSALQRRLAAVLETTTDPVCFADREGRAIYLNEAGRLLLGGQTPDGRPEAAAGWARVLLRPQTLAAAAEAGTWSGEATLLTADGREVTFSQVIICHRNPAGEVEFYSTIARDISERKRFERRLAEEKERAEVTLGSIGDAVVRTDARGIIEYLNPVAEQLLGSRNSELIGLPIANVLSLVHETTREPLENPIETCLREKRVIGRSNLSLLVRPDGREFAIDDSAAPVTNREREVIGAVLVFHDVSRARTLARQLAHQASHDFLTGLVNRHEFERRVGRAISRAQQEGVQHALCFLDLDQFKVVNDTCGHVAGDELLRRLANELLKKVRRRDTLARLGGDEFGVLLEHCPPGQATRVAHDLLETVQEFRFAWEGQPFALGVSVGVVPITTETESLATVLRHADAACYAAKERGRNRVHFYEPNDAVLALRQGEMQWVTRITSALEEHRFRLFGQAILPLSPHPGERPRVEVLLRLVERDGTLIAPGAFIPAAERYGLMGAVDRWVLREVMSLYGHQRGNGMRPIASINLSGASLGDPGMLAFVRDQLDRYDLPPESLCFEITETAAIANLAQAAHFIRELKALGCWFALDDFGSGMSSFAYLQSLPVDFLKIAGAFLRHIDADPVEYAMVEAINRVGHVMHLKTVAEGVENLQTLDTLRALGVDYAQGFAINEPSPMEDLAAFGSRAAIAVGAHPRQASLPAAPRTRPTIVRDPG
ncbi:MAG TPA: EAL domain-containing protein [Gemmatimonadales bacterium]|nr:EAL domain-containing protein [Gemmatimonadales bacterium]